MLDKIAKACYNPFALFVPFVIKKPFQKLKFLRAFTKPLLKGWLDQLFKTNSFKPYL
ncbi:hypothetical protein HPHPA11_0481 [Helicobacter pylori Hp A-11]|uniref:Uncharacterized protein n=1 Tax=Helicobacter pylori Hp A-11 TaxID=992035 RepID=N4TRK7_HELPX|nr:hypothetical protein HPHPA11_0481 [Helicobacter pylori Hp A-11]